MTKSLPILKVGVFSKNFFGFRRVYDIGIGITWNWWIFSAAEYFTDPNVAEGERWHRKLSFFSPSLLYSRSASNLHPDLSIISALLSIWSILKSGSGDGWRTILNLRFSFMYRFMQTHLLTYVQLYMQTSELLEGRVVWVLKNLNIVGWLLFQWST